MVGGIKVILEIIITLIYMAPLHSNLLWSAPRPTSAQQDSFKPVKNRVEWPYSIPKWEPIQTKHNRSKVQIIGPDTDQALRDMLIPFVVSLECNLEPLNGHGAETRNELLTLVTPDWLSSLFGFKFSNLKT